MSGYWGRVKEEKGKKKKKKEEKKGFKGRELLNTTNPWVPHKVKIFEFF